MALNETSYDRAKAVEYAHIWAYRRNPKFYDFSAIGGDCTNYASQCLFAGCGIMNFTPDVGWYYKSINDRAAAWTSVPYFNRFMVNNLGVGPYGQNVSIDEVEPGDFVQLRFVGKNIFGHTPVIVSIENESVEKNDKSDRKKWHKRTTDDIYIAAHSGDCDCRPLSTYYGVAEIRYIHIIGARYTAI